MDILTASSFLAITNESSTEIGKKNKMETDFKIYSQKILIF